MQTYIFSANGGPNIVIEGALAVTNQTMPGGTVGQSYSHQFIAVNGTAPYQFSLDAGNFPAGLSMNATGLVSGAPLSAGSFAPPVVRVVSQ